MQQKSLTTTITECMFDIDVGAIPADLSEQAKRLLIDLLGVGIAGSVQEEVAPIFQTFKNWGGKPESLVWNYGVRLPAHAASVVNGAFAHALELDDTHRTTYLHVGASIVPTVFAIGEVAHSSGGEVLRALIAGYETMLRIALAVSPEHRFQGFHPTGTLGVFGTAMAASLLLKLDIQQTVHALGLAGTQSSGLFQFVHDGCSSKRYHPGHAAQSGITAAYLAKAGFTGSAEILEGEDGFFKVMSPQSHPDRVTDRLGSYWHILEMGIKPYSACRFCHAPIDAARALRAHPAWDISKLQRLELICSRQLFEQTGNNAPSTPMGAQLSTPNAMAIALIYGSNMPVDIEAHFNDPQVAELAKQIVLTVDNNIPRTARNVLLKAQLQGVDSELHFTVALPKGEPENPLSREETRNKFLGLSSPVLGKSKAEKLLQVIEHIEDIADIQEIMPVLTAEA